MCCEVKSWGLKVSGETNLISVQIMKSRVGLFQVGQIYEPEKAVAFWCWVSSETHVSLGRDFSSLGRDS